MSGLKYFQAQNIQKYLDNVFKYINVRDFFPLKTNQCITKFVFASFGLSIVFSFTSSIFQFYKLFILYTFSISIK